MTLNAGIYAVPKGHVAAVVTYLEMTAPDDIPAKPFPTGITAHQERLENESYRALFRAVGAPWLWTSRLMLSDEALAAILSDTQTELWVVRQAGAPIGLIELDFSAKGLCELAFFGIIPSATGQGVGGAMMALAQRQAFRGDVELFTVHTCTLDDPRALGFYQNAGFRPIKRDVEIFQDPRINGAYDPETARQIPCLP